MWGHAHFCPLEPNKSKTKINDYRQDFLLDNSIFMFKKINNQNWSKNDRVIAKQRTCPFMGMYRLYGQN